MIYYQGQGAICTTFHYFYHCLTSVLSVCVRIGSIPLQRLRQCKYLFNVQSSRRPGATALIKVADDALIKVTDGPRHHDVLLAEADEFLADDVIYDPCKNKKSAT
jgi:hypothetical protein